MRAVVQRVVRATVTVDGDVCGAISKGLLVFLGVGAGDGLTEAEQLSGKVAALRIFEDESGRMNRSAAEVGASVLCVSQFTLYGDVRRGNRPSFDGAAPPQQANALYLAFCAQIEALGLPCERGIFGAHMEVDLLNDGPVTLVLDTSEMARPRSQ